MNLLVLSHKETWPDPNLPGSYATTGGFPMQMQAISELFDQTLVIVPLRNAPPPSGLLALTGHNLTVQTLPEPTGIDFRRKLALLTWLPRYLPNLWQAIHRADVIHAPVPGDIGLIGILLALAQRKPLFIRHCGTWGKPVTATDRFLLWLLEHIAGGRNVVLATGGSDRPPSKKNAQIEWIFSSSLTDAEILSLPTARGWEPPAAFHIVTVGRLSQDKNIQEIIRALPAIYARFPDVTLDILGEGVFRPVLEKMAEDFGLQKLVIFHGNLPHEDVLKILSHSHLFVFPSLREGFPKAVLEALACGLPVVASDVSVIPFLISDCGKVLEVPDAKHIAAAILELLENPACLQGLGENARQKAKSYTLESWQAQIAGHLKTVWGKDLHEPT